MIHKVTKKNKHVQTLVRIPSQMSTDSFFGAHPPLTTDMLGLKSIVPHPGIVHIALAVQYEI